MKKHSAWLAIVAVVILLFTAPDAFADTPGNTNVGFYDELLRRFQSAAIGWQFVLIKAASWLFWTLVVISMVWTFGMMALRKADIGEFFAEFVRFTIFTGFFWWLLINGPNFAVSIMQSLSQLGASAGGLPSTPGRLGITPSSVVDLGFKIFEQIIDHMSFWPNKFHLSLMGGLIGLGIMVILCLIGLNMLLLLLSAWFLAYAGIFFLGFGGSRWTSEMAINYYKTVLGLAAQILAMVLLIGIGQTFLEQYYATLKNEISATNLKSMAALLMACVVLFVLTSRIPSLLAGIITGGAMGGGGVSTLASTVGMAGMAGAAVATGGVTLATSGATLTAGGAAVSGGAQAMMAAFSRASQNISSSDSDLMSAHSGGGGGDRGGSDEAGTSQDTPFAQAAGFHGGDSSPAGSAVNALPGGGGTAAAAGGDVLASAAKAGGSEAKAKTAGTNNSVTANVAETTGGKLAAAAETSSTRAGSGAQAAAEAETDVGSGAQATAETNAGAGAPAETGAGADVDSGAATATSSSDNELTGKSLSADSGGDWINQTGGFSELSEADQTQAVASHSEWQAQGEGNTLGVEDYVSYAQARNAEAANFVHKKT